MMSAPMGMMEAVQQLPPDLQQKMMDIQRILMSKGPAGLTPELKDEIGSIQDKIMSIMKGSGHDTSMFQKPT
jgi:hypothetical protein